MYYQISSPQKGNVLFIILIAVALFAALSYAITSSSRTGENSPKSDNAKVIAAEMMSFASSINQSIDRLRIINGCRIEEISFQDYYDLAGHNFTNIDTNSLRRLDGRCDVFKKSGGGVPAIKFPSRACQSEGNCFFGFVKTHILNVGVNRTGGSSDPTGNEIILWARYVRKDVCNALRKLNGISTDANVASGISINSAIYTPSAAAYSDIGDLDTELSGKPVGCYWYGGEEYDAYFTIVPK